MRLGAGQDGTVAALTNLDWSDDVAKAGWIAERLASPPANATLWFTGTNDLKIVRGIFIGRSGCKGRRRCCPFGWCDMAVGRVDPIRRRARSPHRARFEPVLVYN